MKNHCCFCVQLTLILSAIASTLAFGQTVLTVDGTKGVTAEGVNGVFNPNICSVTPAPSWCSGSDIGAWTNAAIGQLSGSCGEIYIPAGSYTYTTTIVKPRCVKIHGASAESTILNWNLSTGWAVAVNDSSSPTAYPEGDIADLTLDGPGTTGNNGGIYFGGTDQLAGFTGTVSTSGTAVTGTGFSTTTWTGGTPVLILVSSTWTQFVISTVNSSTSITLTTSAGTNTNVGMTVVGAPSTTVAPSANYGDHQNVNRVRIINFGAGEMWGENAWSTTTDQSVISNNGMNAYFPVNESSNNSGERINFVDSSIQNALGYGLYYGDNTTGDMHVTDCSVDYNGYWGIANGSNTSTNQNQVTSIKGGHIEQPSYFLQNYGTMLVEGVLLGPGSGSGTPGYLIDNEFAGMVFIGGYIHNNGTGTIFNSSGVGAVCIGITATGTLNNCAGTIDRFGNAAFQGLGAVNLTLSGTGCSSGTYAKADGTGCGTPSGSGTPTIVGPASAFSTTSTTGATVFSYTNSIAAGSTVMLDCVGSYEFTGAAETAEFGIDLSATPQSMALNVEVGANTSTETHSLAGVQTANNTLQTGATAAATTGVFYPVTISGGVVTNASSTSTFTIVGATSNASGTLKANAKGFACSVK